MALYESPALTIRSMRLGDTDRLTTFLTLRYGKIKAVAKGAVKQKSRLAGRTEPFIFGNLIFFGKEKAELYRLNSFDIVEPFQKIRNDFNRLNRAFVSAELVDAICKEKDVNIEGFKALLAFWRSLEGESKVEKQNLALRLFELKFLFLSGFGPMLEMCVECGKKVGAKAGFNPRKGGAMCESCFPKDPYAVGSNAGAIKLMAKAISLPTEKLTRLAATPRLYEEIERMVNSLVATHVRRSIRSERFLRL